MRRDLSLVSLRESLKGRVEKKKRALLHSSGGPKKMRLPVP
jgi:hypothetical protein